MHHYRHIDRSVVQFDFLLNEEPGSYYEEEAASLGANIYYRPRRAKNPAGCQAALFQLLRHNPEIRVVHMHGETPIMALDARTAKRAGVEVRMLHSRSAQQQISLSRLIFRPWVYRYGTHLLACSTEAGASLYGSKAAEAGRLILLPNARPLSPFFFDENMRMNIRREMDVEGRLVLTNVGRLNRWKNQLFLLDIMAELRLKHPEAILLVAGMGEMEGALREKITALKLQDNVRLLGRCDRVNDLLQASDIFMLPSLIEGLPGSAIEAQASGLPCLLGDGITRECAITPHVEFLSIDRGPDVWVQKILAQQEELPSRDTKQLMMESGYDIGPAAGNLQQMYLSAVKSTKQG